MIRYEKPTHPDDALVVFITHPEHGEMILATIPDDPNDPDEIVFIREAIDEISRRYAKDHEQDCAHPTTVTKDLRCTCCEECGQLIEVWD